MEVWRSKVCRKSTFATSALGQGCLRAGEARPVHVHCQIVSLWRFWAQRRALGSKDSLRFYAAKKEASVPGVETRVCRK